MIAAALPVGILAVDYSPREVVLGEAVAAGILKRYPVSSNTRVRETVVRVVAKLALDTAFQISILSGDTDDSHEPFWALGGYLFVPEDLLKYAQDESEIAAMPAHAIGHIEIDHEARMAGGMSGVSVLGLGARRRYERRADAFAVDALRKAGYDPGALARFLRRVQGAAPSEELAARLEQLAAR